jgi:hypothetical protein
LIGELPKDYKLEAKDFVHLHNHTHYSLLDGLTKIDELVDFVKEKGMEAVAVTDHGTMCGLVELYKTCEGAGLKSIMGLEAYVAARNKEDRDPAYDKKRFHITLLAMNDQGFENLSRLLTDAEIDGKKNVLKWESQEGSVSWTVEVPETGLYSLGLEYQGIKRTNKAIQMSLKIDGNHPFKEADEFSFSRTFIDERDEEGNFKKDPNGNDRTPNYIEQFVWRTADFMDFEGMHTEPFVFYLEKGKHTIELGIIREPLYIASILLNVPDKLPEYKDISHLTGAAPRRSYVQHTSELV